MTDKTPEEKATCCEEAVMMVLDNLHSMVRFNKDGEVSNGCKILIRIAEWINVTKNGSQMGGMELTHEYDPNTRTWTPK